MRSRGVNRQLVGDGLWGLRVARELSIIKVQECSLWQIALTNGTFVKLACLRLAQACVFRSSAGFTRDRCTAYLLRLDSLRVVTAS